MTQIYMRGGVYYGTAEDMIDRIEELEAVVGRQHKRAETLAEGWRIADDARIELEAKLAKVVEALEHLVYLQSGNPCTGIQAGKWLDDARSTLAELKEETHE